MITRIALAAFALGPVLAHFGITPPLIGFGVFALGAITAAITGIRALVALLRGGTLQGQQWVTVAVALFLVGSAGRSAGLPRINDFTTDPTDPPAFRHATTLKANVGRDMRYPADFAAQQQACCADLQPAQIAADAFARAQTVAAAMPTWAITNADATAGTIEATATSGWFRFEDDIVIRVRPGEGGQSRVDVRSKSRDGKGDMGANAARIRAFLNALAAPH